MPEDTGTAAQSAKRCGWQEWQWLRAPAVARAQQGSVVQGQIAGAGVVKLRAAEVGTAMAQGSGVAKKQEDGRENMK